MTDSDPPLAAVETAAIIGPSPDHPVTCGCYNGSCPVIASLSVNGGKAIPAYCNANGPNDQGQYGLRYQCVEFSERFLAEGLGQPLIPAHPAAVEMCGTADAGHYTVFFHDSSHVPVPGDVLVWYSKDPQNTSGHTAVVSKVNPLNLEFVQQNFGLRPVPTPPQYPQYPIGTARREHNFFGSPSLDSTLLAKCLIHPKVLDQPPTGGGTVVDLKANNGQYVSSQGGIVAPAMNVYANRSAVGPWEKFRLVPISGGYAIACQGASTPAFYVSAEGGGGSAVHCNRTAVGPWETFKLERKSALRIAFRTSNGHYLSAQNGGGSGVDATRTAVGLWETFTTSEAPGEL